MINLRVAITGSSGFLGQNYTKSAKNIFADFFALRRDDLRTFDYEKVDVVVHFAAIAHTKKVTGKEYFIVNRDLAVEIASKAKSKGVKQFVFLSSVKVYGDELNQRRPYLLSDSPYPNDEYGISKLQAEAELKKMHSEHFCVTIIRLPLVYGPGVKANMLGLLKLIDKVPVLPLGNTKNKRSLLYVGNLVAFINRIIEVKQGGTFLISDGVSVSTTDLVKCIAQKLDRSITLVSLPSILRIFLKKVIPSYYQKLWGNLEVNPSDSFTIPNFTPPFGLDEGVKDMVEWYQRTKSLS